MPRISLPLFLASAALLGCQISAIVIPVPVSCSTAGACTQVLNAAFEKCAGAAWCTIELEAGEYMLTAPVYATIINVNNPMNVVLVGSGVDNTILVAQDIGNLFVVSGGSNITFTGFTIDNARPPFTLGTVTSSSPGVSILSVDFNAYPMNEAVYPWLAQVQAVIAYDVAAGRMARGGYDGYFLTNPLHAAYDMGTSTMNLSLQLEVGTTVIMRHQVYSYNAFSVYNSDQLTLLDVQIYSTGGMGCYAQNVSGVLLDGLVITKAPGRVMSITADGFHCSNCGRNGAVIVRGCTFEGQGDDGLNTPTLFSDIESISSDRLTLTVGKDGTIGTNWNLFAAGDPVRFYSRATMMESGESVIASVAAPGTITLASPLPAGIVKYDLMNNINGYSSYVEVTDCVFKDNRARGALLKQSNVYCARNLFDHCTGPAILTNIDGCYWFEGHPITNLTIVNNTMIGCNYATAAQGGDVTIDNEIAVFDNGVPTTTCTYSPSQVQHGITIQANSYYQDAGQSAVSAFSTDTIVITNNDVFSNTTASGGNFAGVACTDATVLSNTCNGGACTINGL